MTRNVNNILRELLRIKPELKDNKAALEKAIEKLVAAKPDAYMDPAFKRSLKAKLLGRIDGENTGLVSRVFKPGRRLVLGFGFGIAAVALLAVFTFVVLSPPGNEVANLSQDKSAKPEEITDRVSEAQPAEAKSEERSIVPGTEKAETDYAKRDREKGILQDKTDSSTIAKTEEYSRDSDTAGGSESFGYVDEFLPTIAEEGRVDDIEGEERESLEERKTLRSKDTVTATGDLVTKDNSYAVVREYITRGALPPRNAVRTDELVNNFPYVVPAQKTEGALSAYAEVSSCPWDGTRRLLMVVLLGNAAASTIGAYKSKTEALPVTADAREIIASDIRLLLSVNPAALGSYTLIGGAARGDSGNGSTVAGALRTGQSIVFLYELAPVLPAIKAVVPERATDSSAEKAAVIRIDFRKGDAGAAGVLTLEVVDAGTDIASSSEAFRFASAVAEWGLVINGSLSGSAPAIDRVLALAKGSLGADADGKRKDFLSIVESSRELFTTADAVPAN